jgi:hypothetical protein
MLHRNTQSGSDMITSRLIFKHSLNAINIINVTRSPSRGFGYLDIGVLRVHRRVMVILASAYTNFYFGPPRHHLQCKNPVRMTPSLANHNAKDQSSCTVQTNNETSNPFRYHVHEVVSRGRTVLLRFTDSSIDN